MPFSILFCFYKSLYSGVLNTRAGGGGLIIGEGDESESLKLLISEGGGGAY